MFVESPFQAIAPDYEIYVLDVRRLSDQEIMSYSKDLRVLFFMLKYARDKLKLESLISTDRAFRNVPDDIIDVLTPYIGKRGTKHLQAKLRLKEGEFDMDTWFEKLYEDMKQEGRDEGIRALVDAYKNEMHLDNDTILSKITSKFQISRDYAVTLL